MGKVLKVLGGLVLVLIVFVGGVWIYGVLVGPKLDADSKAYVDKTIPILVNDWNPEELKSRASKELLPFLKETDLNSLYAMFKKLGRMTRYNGSKGKSHTNINIPNGILTAAGYIATVDFENGPGTISMSLIRRNGNWQILGLQVDSPIYLRQ